MESQSQIAEVTPVEGEPERFWCASARRGHDPHLVDADYTDEAGVRGWACSCEDFMCRNRPCKHIARVKAFLATDFHR